MVDLNKIYEHVFAIEYRQGFKSYDIYDGSGLRIPGLSRLKPVRVGSTYFNKFSPFNIRKWLGISERKYPHAVACMVNAFCNAPVEHVPEKFIREQVEWLISISLIQRYGYHCWNGLGIFIDMKDGAINPTVPGLIGTSTVARALAGYFQKTSDPRIPDILRSVRDDLVTNYYLEYSGTSFFRYKPVTPSWKFTINASAIGAALLCHINHLLGETKGMDQVGAAISSILNTQEEDGRWKYTIDLKDGKHKEQADFHQAYVIKALMDIHQTGILPISMENAIRRGLNYQNNVQLEPSGALYYRYPRKFPSNIHNQLYAFYVNQIASEVLNEAYNDKASLIFFWTLKHLYEPSLGFIYGAYPCLKIKIPYSRWGNAHALYLISHLINNKAFPEPTGTKHILQKDSQ